MAFNNTKGVPTIDEMSLITAAINSIIIAERNKCTSKLSPED